jgi:hypothetical protein
MEVDVDGAGEDVESRRVDLLPRGPKCSRLLDRDDQAVLNGDIGWACDAVGDDGAVQDSKIVHRLPGRVNC